MGTPSMGHQALFGAGTANPVTSQFEFLSCDIGKRGTLIESPGMRGSRSYNKESVNTGPYTAGGSVVMEPRPDELVFWLPYILGAAASGTTFALAETVGEFYATVDKIAKVYTYAGCKVNQAVFESSPGQNLRMSLAIEGKTETQANAGTFPSISASLSVLQPYIHHQAVLTLGGTAYAIRNVRVTIDNGLILDRFDNSTTRTALPESDRIITLSCENPFTSDETALYDLAIAGVAGTLVYTNGNYSLTFTFANLKAAAESPVIGGRNIEIPLTLNFKAYMSGATRELVVTNDSTG
jgi:hypothetical protein